MARSASISKKAKVKEGELELARFKKLAKSLRAELKKEYAEGASIEPVLRERLLELNREADTLSSELRRAKALAKKRKKEISEWKNWFASLVESDTSSELRQLQDEIQWRSGEIAFSEEKISSLFEKKLALEQEEQMISVRLKAIESGVYHRSVEEDPRWIALSRKLDETK